MDVPATLLLCFHAGVIGLLLVALANCLANLACFEKVRPLAAPATGPLVSILIPARNEERSIGACARSLIAQTWPNAEVLVLNDGSTDRTGGVLAELGFAPDHRRLRSLTGAPLPAGWVGKNWACQQLSEAARGEFLYFTDADTVHRPEAVASAMAALSRHQADFVSPWPQLVAGSWSEHLVLPMLHLLGMATYPHWLVFWLQARPQVARRLAPWFLRKFGAGNGQCMLFRAASYRAIGGHASVPGHLVEDLALGREVAARMGAGMRFWNCDGSRLIDCRMYHSFDELWEGFTKNVRPAFERSSFEFFSFGLVHMAAFFWPFLLVWLPGQRSFALVEIALVYVLRTLLAIRFRTSWFGVLLHPAGDLLCILIALNSWRRSTFSAVTWKGRSYQPAT